MVLRAYVGFCVVSALEVNARAWPMARGDEPCGILCEMLLKVLAYRLRRYHSKTCMTRLRLLCNGSDFWRGIIDKTCFPHSHNARTAIRQTSYRFAPQPILQMRIFTPTLQSLRGKACTTSTSTCPSSPRVPTHKYSRSSP